MRFLPLLYARHMQMLEKRSVGGLDIRSAETSALGVRIAFTTRLGGVSESPFDSLNLSGAVGDDAGRVEENRRRVERAVGFEEGSITLLKQIHGADVVAAAPGACGVIGEGDALVVTEPGTTVGVLTADCVPVLMVGPEGAAAAHAGWRGLVAGTIEEASAAIGGATAAWVGPSIHACCYEVGPEVIAAFEDASLPVADATHVDPGRAALSVLRRLGVTEVAFADDCTSCDPTFFSYRREGPTTGRQGGFIAWV